MQCVMNASNYLKLQDSSRGSASCRMGSGSAGVAEAAGAAGGVGEVGRFRQLGPLHARDHQLGDALPPRQRDRLLPEVDENDPDLAAEIGVDGARAVEAGEPFAQAPAAAGPDL